MTSKRIVLRALDGIFVTFTAMLILWIDMSPGEFHLFAMFVVFAALWLMHAIATSDSAP